MARPRTVTSASTFVSTLAVGLLMATGGCFGSKQDKRIAPPPPPPPPAVAAPAEDPMLVTLSGATANKYLPAAQAGDIIARLRIDSKQFARDERPPVNLALVLDTSGSMAGDAIDHARAAALELLEQLEAGDRLAVIAFHSTSEVLVPSTELTDDNKSAIGTRISAMQALGTTDMAGGMNLALQQLAPHVSEQQLSRVVLLSDGVPNDEAPIMALAQNAQQHGIAITALGLGLDYNETLLANMAQRSGGAFHYVEEPSLVAGVFRDEVLRLERVVARSMTLTLNPGPGVTVQEVIGLPLQRPNQRTGYVQLGDLSEGEPRDVLVRLHVSDHREGANVELLDGVLSFVDAVAEAGSFQRRVFLAARATNDVAMLKDGRNLAVEEAVESARAAAATIQAVANARAGNLGEAQRILTVAGPNAREAAKRFNNQRLAQQADEIERLRVALPSIVPQPSGPQPNRAVPSMARPEAAPVPEPGPSATEAPATVRAVHGNAMRTLQGR